MLNTPVQMNDRTLITKNYLGLVLTCLESQGYDFSDFEISTERVQSYTAGQPTPKSILYVFRISTGVEKNYELGANTEYLDTLSKDLKTRMFDSSLIV